MSTRSTELWKYWRKAPAPTTPEERGELRPLLARAGNVPLNTDLWRFWRLVYAPLNIVCAAIAGAHFGYFAQQRKLRSRSRL